MLRWTIRRIDELHLIWMLQPGGGEAFMRANLARIGPQLMVRPGGCTTLLVQVEQPGFDRADA